MRSRLDIILETVSNILNETTQGDVADMRQRGERKLNKIEDTVAAIFSPGEPSPNQGEWPPKARNKAKKWKAARNRLARRIKTRAGVWNAGPLGDVNVPG